MTKIKDTARTVSSIQADIDALTQRSDALGVDIQAARRNPKFLDFMTLSGKESERNHISNSQLPPLRAELKAAQLAEAQREYETLDAQRVELQDASRAANLAVQAAQKEADAGPRYMEKADAAFYRRRGQANIALADAMDVARPLAEQSTALEFRVMECRRVLSEAGALFA